MPKPWPWIRPGIDETTDPPTKIYPPWYRKGISGWTTGEMYKAYGRLYRDICPYWNQPLIDYTGIPCWWKFIDHEQINYGQTGFITGYYDVSGVRNDQGRTWIPSYEREYGGEIITMTPKTEFHFPKYDDTIYDHHYPYTDGLPGSCSSLSYFDLTWGTYTTHGPRFTGVGTHYGGPKFPHTRLHPTDPDYH